ncbi:haloacid dehalogenase superfamily, subfamily IA, variant 3 with third motif having DD or ED [Aliiruegeria lutimaris]|uniref:Haloacid dehalogenase superfamily, subfamily IA, variant 3 with third motif having DD or ED n=1 Tax=Aliiruegeria lutimaris TaxID=571298 RepID=A0A1G8RY74_9RHOB|nr:haloacid dehalogenase superfamily, subfamily IA, variant 3 with third motif having DD or ED [Aliiruegeria lutimaris]
MCDLIDMVKAAGLTTCIVSGSGMDRIRRTLASTGLTGYFAERIFSGEEVPRGKPAPDLFLHAAGELGVAPADCMVIEDAPLGVQGAIAAGMRAFGFTRGSHLDGIRKTHGGRLSKAGAKAVFASTPELRQAVSREAGLDGAQAE